jgi:hypothetical protein
MFGKKKKKTIDFLTGHASIEKLVEALHLHLRKKHPRPIFKFLKYFGIFLLAIFFIIIITAGILFFHFKGFYDLAILGKNNLQDSLISAQDKNFSAMGGQTLTAENSFTDLARELEALRNSPVLKKLNIGQKELADVDSLIQSAGAVSRALNQAAVIGSQWNDILGGKFGANFSAISSNQKQALLKSIFESGPELNSLKANLDLAVVNLNNVEADGFLSPLKGKIDEAKNKLIQASNLLSEASVVSQLAPEFFGYPTTSTFLVLFENNAELRPTGGFLGTYGILQTQNGDVLRFDSHDIYHMDQPMEALRLLRIVPPAPLAEYLNKNWYMRDANWSPDWPSSAKQIIWFYNKENALLPPKNKINNFSGDFTGVIAVTPELVTSLLDLTGPITINGEQFNKDNFSDLLEYKVEEDIASENVTSWQRKEIIGKILAAMKEKLFNLDYSVWPYALTKINDAVKEKNILVYSPNDYDESLIQNLNAGGELKNQTGDYLMAVDANLGARKTDSVMQKNISYQVRKKSDGLYADLKITYTNTALKIDWRTTDYRSYTRAYLPSGSEIKNVSGLAKNTNYQEAGKTVVGGLLQVPLGHTVNLEIYYKLPTYLNDQFSQGSYQLLVQKQPGNMVNSLKVDVMAPSAIKSYNPLDSGKVVGNDIIWNSDLIADKEFRLNF